MSSETSITRWQEEVQQHLRKLSPAQGRVLGQWSYGMVLTNGCGITRVSHWLAKQGKCPAGRVRQRLREWYYEAEAKRGRKRREVQVEECFGDLLTWALEGWEGKQEVVLVLDATTLGERFTALCISVLVRGCAIPVAWHLMRANQPGPWKPHWLALLESLRGAIAAEWTVVVMADQGLYAPWLFEAIQAQGWHPMLRVSEQMGMRATGEETFEAIGERVKRRGRQWQGRGEWSEGGERLRSTVMVCWERGYEHKLAVVSDLAPEEVKAAWYQMRFWIEGGFKDQKRGGLRWEQTKMRDPGRASRLWLAMAVALLWMVRVGSEQEAQEQAEARKLPRGRARRKVGRPPRQFRRPRTREQSCVVRGQQTISTAVIAGDLPLGHLVGACWPQRWYPARHQARCWTKKRKQRAQTKRRRQREAPAQKQRERRAKRRARDQEPQQAEREARRLSHVRRQDEKQEQRQAQQQEHWHQQAERQRQREEGQQQLEKQFAQRQQQRVARPIERRPEPLPCLREPVPHRYGHRQREALPTGVPSNAQPTPMAGIARGEPTHVLVGWYQGRLVSVVPLPVQQIPP
jgi:hypothetical protein